MIQKDKWAALWKVSACDSLALHFTLLLQDFPHSKIVHGGGYALQRERGRTFTFNLHAPGTLKTVTFLHWLRLKLCPKVTQRDPSRGDKRTTANVNVTCTMSQALSS